MEKYKVETQTKVMNFMNFQDYIKELFFDENTEFSFRGEVKEFEGSLILQYTVTFSDGTIVTSSCVLG